MAAQVDEDLEYHVTFPPPTPGSDAEISDEGFESTLRKTETAVMLVGWMGSRDKHLVKYSEVWTDKGCTTVRYSPTKSDMMPSRRRMIAKKLLEVLVEMNLAENPVLFHIFSNGGCRIYFEMLNELNTNSEFEDIQKLGVVYDSCPGRSKLSTSVNVLFSQFPQNFLFTILKAVAYGLGGLLMGADCITRFFVGLSIAPSTIYDEMMFVQDNCPELYLYTKEDKVTQFTDIENLIQQRRMQSVDITAMCWDNGEHVALLKTHPEAYMNRCYQFISQCLQRAAEME